jgi:hypothetical protein
LFCQKISNIRGDGEYDNSFRHLLITTVHPGLALGPKLGHIGVTNTF